MSDDFQFTRRAVSVRRAAALDAPFDPSLHEALAEQDDGSQPPGTVVRVPEDGYNPS
jgi:molecular chaperone GrpE